MSPVLNFDLTPPPRPISLTIARFSTPLSLSKQRDSIVLGRLSEIKRSGRDRNLTDMEASLGRAGILGWCKVVDFC